MRYIAVSGAIVLIFMLVMGSVTTDTYEDQTKIIVVVFGLHKDGVAEESVEVQYGHPPNLGHQNGNFIATVRANNGTPLFTFDVWDPRNQFDEYGLRNQLEQHELVEDKNLEKVYEDLGETDDIDLPLIIPYHRDIQTVDLIDRNSSSLMISVNISPAVNTFRNRFPKDPDMIANTKSVIHGTQSQADNQWIFLMTGSGFAIILLALLIRLVRKS